MINPSVMRSAAWRSGLLGDLNSIDYASLSKLKASAESAKLYDAAVRKTCVRRQDASRLGTRLFWEHIVQ